MPYSPLNISARAASVVPYEYREPTAFKWVSPTGSDSNPGSATAPYKTIQKATSVATPGTAVMVKAGTYTENVYLKKSGYADKPIWIVSADGAGKADIVAKNAGAPVIQGYGLDNVVIKGFELVGGTEGIKLTQSGSNFSNLVSNVVIEHNHIRGQSIDGIKTAQGLNLAITGNTVHNIAKQEGIDNVYLRNSVIAENNVYDVRGLSGIVVKSGSQNNKILDNEVHGTPDGILIGGFSGAAGSIWPKGLSYQAKGTTVEGNHVNNVSKQSINSYGAVDTYLKGNYLDNTSTLKLVHLSSDNLGHQPKNFQISNNILGESNWLYDPKHAVTLNSGNKVGASFSTATTGPDSMTLVGVDTTADSFKYDGWV